MSPTTEDRNILKDIFQLLNLAHLKYGNNPIFLTINRIGLQDFMYLSSQQWKENGWEHHPAIAFTDKMSGEEYLAVLNKCFVRFSIRGVLYDSQQADRLAFTQMKS